MDVFSCGESCTFWHKMSKCTSYFSNLANNGATCPGHRSLRRTYNARFVILDIYLRRVWWIVAFFWEFSVHLDECLWNGWMHIVFGFLVFIKTTFHGIFCANCCNIVRYLSASAVRLGHRVRLAIKKADRQCVTDCFIVRCALLQYKFYEYGKA